MSKISLARGSVAAKRRALMWGETMLSAIARDNYSGSVQINVARNLRRDEALKQRKVARIGVKGLSV
ncbi:MAG: hypothetical protein WAM53_17395 [Terrimicrobiaceae bacterium]